MVLSQIWSKFLWAGKAKLERLLTTLQFSCIFVCIWCVKQTWYSFDGKWDSTILQQLCLKILACDWLKMYPSFVVYKWVHTGQIQICLFCFFKHFNFICSAEEIKNLCCTLFLLNNTDTTLSWTSVNAQLHLIIMNVTMTFSNQSSILIHSLSFAGHANFTFIEGRNVENATNWIWFFLLFILLK